ncbi:MAG: helix-turn-helix domain-containing protein [Oscillospiraceae bacterium]
MKKTKNTYQDGRNNSIFSQKLRGLFANSGKTHGNLADYIKQYTGDSVTRQAIGQWCNGNTSPSLKIVPIIANFFDVSTDYLLGCTEIKTANADLKATCEYTRLSEKAVQILHDLPAIDGDVRLTIIYLLEQYAEKLSDYIDCGGSDFNKIDCILNALSKYLRITPNDSLDALLLTESGKLINLMATNPEEIAIKIGYKDIINSQYIDTKEIINRILVDKLEFALNQAKEEYANIVKYYPSATLDGEVTLSDDSIAKIQKQSREMRNKIMDENPFLKGADNNGSNNPTKE